MSENEVATTASAVLGESSEDAIRARLVALSASMDGAGFIELMVRLLLKSNLDRDRLKQRVADLLASRFGKSSEKASPDQLALFATLIQALDGAKSASPDAPEPPDDEPTLSELMAQTDAEIAALVEEQRQAKARERERQREAAAEAQANGAGSERWPSHLPVREETRPVPDGWKVCDDCGVERAVIGYETSWRLEYETTATVVVTKTPTLACRSHHGGPLTEPVEPKPVDGGRMGFSLASRILYLRYAQNLPILRCVEMLGTEGVPLSEEMVHTLVRVTAKRLTPVVEAVANQVRLATLVNLDDTQVRVLKKAGKPAPHRARVWLALGDERWAWFFATKTWKAREVEEHLGKLTGTIQGDGYAGYPKFARRQGLDLAGCWGHVRRKLVRAHRTKDPRAGPALALVQGLYRIEKLAKLRRLEPDDIVALRQQRAAPLVRALEAWAMDVASSIEKDSPLGEAWTYLSNQWDRLQLYLSDGTVSLTNDAAERGLRRITIGRKLWLFFQGDHNASWAADIASIFATARLHGADELQYITWLLREVARRAWSPEAARQLLPDVWLARQKKQAEEGSGIEV
jgi:transposase